MFGENKTLTMSMSTMFDQFEFINYSKPSHKPSSKVTDHDHGHAPEPDLRPVYEAMLLKEMDILKSLKNEFDVECEKVPKKWSVTSSLGLKIEKQKEVVQDVERKLASLKPVQRNAVIENPRSTVDVSIKRSRKSMRSDDESSDYDRNDDKSDDDNSYRMSHSDDDDSGDDAEYHVTDKPKPHTKSKSKSKSKSKPDKKTQTKKRSRLDASKDDDDQKEVGEAIMIDDCANQERVLYLNHIVSNCTDRDKDDTTNINMGFRTARYSRLSSDPRGRFYLRKTSSSEWNPQCPVGGKLFRRYVYDGLAWDLDASCCLQTIMTQYGSNKGVELKYMSRYVRDRESYLQSIMVDESLNRDAAKELVTAICMGEKYRGNSKFLSSLHKEIKRKLIPLCARGLNLEDDEVHKSISMRYFAIESQMLMAMKEFFGNYTDQNGIIRTFVMALIHDGCILRKYGKYSTAESVDAALEKMSKFVYSKIDMRIQFVRKPLDLTDEDRMTILKMPFVVKRNPLTAATIFHERMRLLTNKPFIYRMDCGQSAVFNKFENHWSILADNQNPAEFDSVLTMFLKDDGFRSYFDSGSMCRLREEIIKLAPYKSDIVKEHIDVREGKLFFIDGYYDTKIETFVPGSNIDFFNPYVVPMRFQSLKRNEDDILFVKNEIFGKPFSDKEVAIFNTKCLAKSLFCIPSKSCSANSGYSNSGKGTLKSCLENAFGSKMVGNFNGNELLSNERSYQGAERDLTFMYHIRNIPLCFGEEFKNSKIDADKYKKIVDTSTTINCRLHYGRSTVSFTPITHLHLLMNGTISFSKDDDAVLKRTLFVEMDRRAVESNPGPNEFLADPSIKEKCNSEKIKAATIFHIIDTMHIWMLEGDKIPQSVIDAGREIVDASPAITYFKKHNGSVWDDATRDTWKELKTKQSQSPEKQKFIERWIHPKNTIEEYFSGLKISSREIIRQMQQIDGVEEIQIKLNGVNNRCLIGFTFDRDPFGQSVLLF